MAVNQVTGYMNSIREGRHCIICNTESPVKLTPCGAVPTITRAPDRCMSVMLGFTTINSLPQQGLYRLRKVAQAGHKHNTSALISGALGRRGCILMHSQHSTPWFVEL